MTRFTEYAPGTPCWVDVSSGDLEATTAFYHGLLSWEVERTRRPEAGGYGMFRLGDADVAGFGPAQEGMPAAWTTYIASADADAIAGRITAAGGTVLAGPMDVFDAGRDGLRGRSPRGHVRCVAGWSAPRRRARQRAGLVLLERAGDRRSGRDARVLRRGLRVVCRRDGRGVLGVRTPAPARSLV